MITRATYVFKDPDIAESLSRIHNRYRKLPKIYLYTVRLSSTTVMEAFRKSVGICPFLEQITNILDKNTQFIHLNIL